VNLTIRARQPGVAQPVCVRAEFLKSDGTYLEGEWLTPSYPIEEENDRPYQGSLTK
jgi:hypothetical protein